MLTSSPVMMTFLIRQCVTAWRSSDGSALLGPNCQQLVFAPGERFKYNATNYVLLGKVIDKLSGQPFIQFITERQLHIAGMPLTVFGDSHDVAPHSARGYTFFRNVDGERRRTDKLGNVFEEFSPFTRAAAGMSSTAEEMARWIIALQQGQLLKAKTSLTTLW